MNEQDLKNGIIEKFGGEDFIDSSVADGEINTDLNEDEIMRIIREDYLHNSTVTVVLVGWETAQRPYVNSEIQASLRDTRKNKHNGLLAVIRDDLYNEIYTSGTCSDCGVVVRNRNNAFYEYYIPNLIKKNHTYHGDKCHYNSTDVYCAVVKYSNFISNPELYIDEAFEKRDNHLLVIKKIPDEGTPRIGKNTSKSLI